MMKFIEDLCISYSNKSSIYGKSSSYLFSKTTLYIAPMINPDGVDLVTGYLNNSSNYINAKNIASNFPDINFPYGWKSNIKGVDFKKYQPVCKVL